MISLWLIAAHLAGDFLLQSRWQAMFKQESRIARLAHVSWYGIPFVPIAIVYAVPTRGHAVVFLLSLVVLHYLTDSRRYLSTPGDVLAWRLDMISDREACRQVWMEWMLAQPVDTASSYQAFDLTDRAIRFPPPNPWPSTSFAVDQTLHVIQVAILAAVFLT